MSIFVSNWMKLAISGPPYIQAMKDCHVLMDDPSQTVKFWVGEKEEVADATAGEHWFTVASMPLSDFVTYLQQGMQAMVASAMPGADVNKIEVTGQYTCNTAQASLVVAELRNPEDADLQAAKAYAVGPDDALSLLLVCKEFQAIMSAAAQQAGRTPSSLYIPLIVGSSLGGTFHSPPVPASCGSPVMVGSQTEGGLPTVEAPASEEGWSGWTWAALFGGAAAVLGVGWYAIRGRW
jgi:hypothetical protein